MKTPHARAAKIVQNMSEALGFLTALAKDSYDNATDGGNPQSVLDAITDIDPSVTAAQAFGFYSGIYASLAAIGKAGGLVAPDPAIFVVQEDGSILYVQPAEPEE